MDDTLYFCVCVLVVTKHFLTKVKEAASCRDPLCVITERKPSGDRHTYTHTPFLTWPNYIEGMLLFQTNRGIFL